MNNMNSSNIISIQLNKVQSNAPLPNAALLSQVQTVKLSDGGPQLTAAVESILGHRKEQQDFAGMIEDGRRILAVVCDGMGGLNGGAAASSTAVRTLLADYQEQKPENGFSAFLCREAAKADQCVTMQTDEQGNPLHGGSTLAAVIISDGKLDWVSVGDSRIYVLRGDSILAVTRDHNYRRELEEALERGEISRDYFENEILTKRSDALTNYLGMGGIRRMERSAQPLELADGDMILLCSDGVYKRLDEDQIKALLLDNRVSPKVALRRMNRMIMQLAARGQDNTTEILIHYHRS